jgi:hypothetical protein
VSELRVPAFLEERLAELDGDVDALRRALVADGWHPKNVERVLHAATSSPRTPPSPPPVAPVVDLPVRPRMFPGPGKRHDCVHESACLGRALSAEPEATAFHCPTWCPHLEAPSFEAPSFEERLANASVGDRGFRP